MFSRMWLAGLVAMGMLSVGIMVARADGDKKPGDSSTTKESHRHVKVDLPYNLLPDLTEDQKEKIIAIHTTELDAEKKLKEQEKTDIMALLTDAQKTELVDLEAKHKAELEAKRADKAKEKNAPTTQPTN